MLDGNAPRTGCEKRRPAQFTAISRAQIPKPLLKDVCHCGERNRRSGEPVQIVDRSSSPQAALALHVHRVGIFRSSGRPVAKSTETFPTRIRASVCANPRRLSRTSLGRSRPSKIVYRRIPGMRRAVVRSGAASRPEFLFLRRCRTNPDPRTFTSRDADRGDRSPVRRGRAENPPDDPAASVRECIDQYRTARQRHQHRLWQHRHNRSVRCGYSRFTPREPRADGLIRQTIMDTTATGIPGTPFAFLPADIVAQIPNLAYQRRSICRSSEQSRRPTALMRPISSTESVRCPGSPTYASSKPTAIRNSMSRSIGRSRTRSG
jgi:hypothetical protein